MSLDMMDLARYLMNFLFTKVTLTWSRSRSHLAMSESTSAPRLPFLSSLLRVPASADDRNSIATMLCQIFHSAALALLLQRLRKWTLCHPSEMPVHAIAQLSLPWYSLAGDARDHCWMGCSRYFTRYLHDLLESARALQNLHQTVSPSSHTARN